MRVVLPQEQGEHMMLMLKQIACQLAALSLSCAVIGCAIPTKSDPDNAVQPDFCATAQAIYISKDDVISDMTARGILKHNLTGRKLCGW